MTAATVRGWLTAAQAHADAATPGPWRAEEDQGGTDDGPEDASVLTGTVLAPNTPQVIAGGADHWQELGDLWPDGNAAFTAAARTALPAALAALAAVLDHLDDMDDHTPVGKHDHTAARIRALIAGALGVEA